MGREPGLASKGRVLGDPPPPCQAAPAPGAFPRGSPGSRSLGMSRRPPAEAAPTLITSAGELAALCERLRSEEFVTVDTEFMRERTYWPELCVVQLGGEKETAVVDAQAEGMDLAPLGWLLADRKV